MHAHTTPRRRPSESVSSKPARAHMRALAIALIGVLVLGSLALVFAGGSLWGPTAAVASRTTFPSPNAVVRDPLTWPFSRDSIWNLPIGASAVYVPGNIKKPTAYGMTTDVDVLVLTPNAPSTPVYYNGDAWNGGSRCSAQGGVLFSAPIPTNFVVPGAGSGNPDGTTPNYATAILAADGHTLIQGQPMARCTAGGTATIMWSQQNEDLLGTGNSGAHGGSMLSSIGGTIRLGELVPGGAIRHALKVNLNGGLGVVDNWSYATWQLASASNGALGAGLGVPRVPWAPDFGGIVQDTLPPASTAALSGSSGTGSWFVSSVGVTVSATDSQSGVATIQVRTDGGAWQLYTSPVTVAGDGTHTLDYYATDVAGNVESTHSVSVKIDTVFPASLSQIAGTPAGSGYLSPVTVTLSASDATSGVQSISYRIDGGAQWTYSAPFRVAGNGTHVVEYHAVDQAGNSEAVHTLSILLSGASGVHATPVSVLSMGGTGGANGWYISNVDATLTASGASGVAISIAYRLDGGSWSTYVGTFTVREGRHTLDYQASDADGYVEALRSLAVKVDTTPPAIVKGADVLAPDAPLSWTGSDGASGIVRYEVSVDGGAFQPLGTSTSVTGHWAVGAHVATVKAWDNAGNQGTTAIPFRVDSSAVPPGQPDPTAPTGPTVSETLSTAPPGSLYMVIGFLIVSAGVMLLNREKDEPPRLRPGYQAARAR